MFCNKCGKEIQQGASFCNSCGTSIVAQPVETPNNAPVQTTTTNNSGNNTKLIVIIVGVLVFIGCIVGVFLLTQKGDKESNNTTTTTTTTTSDTKELDKEKKQPTTELDFTNISFKAEDTGTMSDNVQYIGAYVVEADPTKGRVNVVLKHTNEKNIDIWLYINFYKDGLRIKSERSYKSFIKPNEVAIYEITIEMDEDFDSYDITYTTKVSDTYYVDVPYSASDITYLDYNIDDKFDNEIAKFKNKLNREIYGYGVCTFYNNNNVVYIRPGYLGSVKANEEKVINCFRYDIPEDIKYDDIKFTLFDLHYTEGE